MMDECDELIAEINQVLSPSAFNPTLCSENECKNYDKNNICADPKNNQCEIVINSSDETSSDTNLIKISQNDVAFKNISAREDGFVECNNNERVSELEGIVLQQRKKIDEFETHIRELEHKCQCFSSNCTDLESRLQQAIRQCDYATKEKEAMVMRYAVSEKGVLEQKAARELAEKKLQEVLKEKDLFQQKFSSMVSEKARICQMFDSKCYELKGVQQELERTKSDLSSLETKLKWSQNSLRTEMELHKESAGKVEVLTNRLQESLNEIEKVKREAQESIKAFHHSQENRAHVLDQQLKEQQATLILSKHEREEKEQQVATLKSEFDRLQSKHQLLIQENNSLSVKVQQLERERLENEQKLSELRGCADQHKQDETNLNSLSAAVERLKLQLTHEQEQREVNNQQMSLLKQRNSELETDMDVCRVREADMLLFTQQLTDKNVRLQSEFSSLETKVQQLNCEQTLLKRSCKEQETRCSLLTEQLEKEKELRTEESKVLARHIAEKTKLSEQLAQQLEDQRGENLVIKRKLEISVKEVTKELQQCRKRLEQYEKADTSTNSRSSSSTSLNVQDVQLPSGVPPHFPGPLDHQVLQPDAPDALDRQVLIDHIVKLQRASAKKSEKLDFLEEHVQTLVAELQRKSRLLQNYMMREQAGVLTSNRMDENKAELAKLHGVMASMYGSRLQDESLTLELSLDINRKLQAVLEDTLLKNITLKENVDTLGAEIERLNKLIKL